MAVPRNRARPLGRATDAAVGTSGSAFQAPAKQVSQVKVKVSADAYVGIGSAATPPAASASNSTYLDAGEQEIWSLDMYADRSAYVYVYAVSGTLTAKVSWYG